MRTRQVTKSNARLFWRRQSLKSFNTLLEEVGVGPLLLDTSTAPPTDVLHKVIRLLDRRCSQGTLRDRFETAVGELPFQRGAKVSSVV